MDLPPGQDVPAGYSICPDTTVANPAIHEGERHCDLNSITNTRAQAFTPGFACKHQQPVPDCDSTTMLWLSGPVSDCNDRIVCYGGKRVQVPVYDHADPNQLWEGSTALVDRVGGTNVRVHIYRTSDTKAMANDPLCN
jgi:hypothetical protein